MPWSSWKRMWHAGAARFELLERGRAPEIDGHLPQILENTELAFRIRQRWTSIGRPDRCDDGPLPAHPARTTAHAYAKIFRRSRIGAHSREAPMRTARAGGSVPAAAGSDPPAEAGDQSDDEDHDQGDEHFLLPFMGRPERQAPGVWGSTYPSHADPSTGPVPMCDRRTRPRRPHGRGRRTLVHREP